MKSFPHPQVFSEGNMKLMDEELQEDLMEDLLT